MQKFDYRTKQLIQEEPIYIINDFKFNETSRMARIEGCIITKYRAIDRYITRNYVKYPIYGDWKEKKKNVQYNIKLSNEKLENLNQHSDDFLRKKAREIIKKIDNKSLEPSWYKIENIRDDFLLKIKLKKIEINKIFKQETIKVNNLNLQIKHLQVAYIHLV